MTTSEPPAPRLIGPRILRFERVDSTNTVAAQHAGDAANDGLVVLADEQTAGRGRLGRTWSSPSGDGILLSLLLFPPPALRRPALLTVLAAVAVCETIFESAQLQSVIKWPNDVYVRGRKVCGVLVEQGQGTVIGIGLNVHTPAEVFAAAGLDQAGSLAMFAEKPLDRAAVTATLLARLDDAYAELLAGRTGDLEARWRWHSGLLGRQVRLQTRESTHEGRLLELGFAALLLEEGGHVRGFAPERVEQLTPLP